MISRDEIDATAQELDIGVANVERDYVFGWLISGLFQASALSDSLVLKGGNALRKAYLPLTRFSDDLDFSTSSGVNGDFLLTQLNEVCRFVESKTGVEFDLDRNRIADEQQLDRDRKVFKVRLYFKDFAGLGHELSLKVRMDVTEFDKLYLPAQNRQLIHQYSDFEACTTDIKVVKIEEAIADKLKCLLQRRYCFDLFDVVYAVFVANELEVDRSEIVRVFLKKTIFERSPDTAKSLLMGLPLDLFKGYWHTVVCPTASRMSFDVATTKLREGLETLFAPFGLGQQFDWAFFPSEMRNPILQAGSERKVMQLSYHGINRQVEPYALNYKRTRDGGAREYFYAWDRSGGSSGVPGIRSFVSTEVQSLAITDITFEPRFEVELSKAGDVSTSGYFASTAGRRTSTGGFRRSRRMTYNSGLVYYVQCSYCGKRFKRSKPGRQLNKHKNTYGGQCLGRIGYQVY